MAEEVELVAEVVLVAAEEAEATEVAEDHSEAGAGAQVCVKIRFAVLSLQIVLHL